MSSTEVATNACNAFFDDKGKPWGWEVRLALPVGDDAVSITIPLPEAIDTQEAAEGLARAVNVEVFGGGAEFLQAVIDDKVIVVE
jgi:hypothetical protein